MLVLLVCVEHLQWFVTQETCGPADDLLWAGVTWKPCWRTGIPQVLLWHG